MLHIKDDFSKGPISQVPASWFNSVGKFINNLVGGHGIKVAKNDDSTPSVVEIDPSVVMSAGLQTSPQPVTGISITPDDLGSTTYRNLPAWKAPDAMTGLDGASPSGWERGKTAYRNGQVVDAEHPAVGCSLTVCTHACMRTVSGTTKHELLFARMEFDENGLLVRVVPVPNWYTLM